MTAVIVRVSKSMTKHHGQKQLVEERVSFSLRHSLSLKEVREGTRGRNQEAGADTETVQ